MKRRDQIRLGVVQPLARRGADAPRMLDDALEYIAEAGRTGIDLLLFPEIYPGPTTHDVRYDVLPELASAAARCGVAVAAGTTEKAEDGEEAYYASQVVIDEQGAVRGAYRRTHPRSAVYERAFRTKFWDFEYRAGDDVMVFDMGWATIGISICSEIYVPELQRALALRGAEICLIASGGPLLVDPDFRDNWHPVIRARAVENLMFTAGTLNLFPTEQEERASGPARPAVTQPARAEPGYAMIASPEGVLATAGPGPGIISADLDLARLRAMREHAGTPGGPAASPPFKSAPGVFSLRRPELADALSQELQRG